MKQKYRLKITYEGGPYKNTIVDKVGTYYGNINISYNIHEDVVENNPLLWEKLPLFDIGKWYINNNNELFCVTKITNNGNVIGYGFNVFGNWVINKNAFWVNIHEDVSQWEEERMVIVEGRLLHMANKLYPEGTKIQTMHRELKVVDKLQWCNTRSSETQHLICLNDKTCIYQNGIWAEIIEKSLFQDKNDNFWYESDFKKGDVYYCIYKNNTTPHIFRASNKITKFNDISDLIIHNANIIANDEQFRFKDDLLLSKGYTDNLRKATQNEKNWLERCEKAGKYVPKEKELPESWEDYRDSFNHIIAIPRHEPFTSMNKLILLRDAYRDDWKPDWTTTNKFKNIIQLHKNVWIVNTVYHINYPFSFQSKEIRDKFFKNFKDLLEQVKPLFI